MTPQELMHNKPLLKELENTEVAKVRKINIE